MARRNTLRERQLKNTFENLYTSPEGTSVSGEPISTLRVAQGDKLGMDPVLRNRGESISAAFRRVQQECAGSVRPYVICLE